MENATGLAHSDARNVLKEAFKGPAAKPLGGRDGIRWGHSGVAGARS